MINPDVAFRLTKYSFVQNVAKEINFFNKIFQLAKNKHSRQIAGIAAKE